MKQEIQYKYKQGVSSVYTLKYHVVFCPKYRKALLINEVASRLIEVLEEKSADLDINILTKEIMPDHVHLFLELKPTKSVAHYIAQLKGYSSKILRQEFPHLKSRIPSLWTRSYYVGSVGHMSEATVKKYIENQRTK